MMADLVCTYYEALTISGTPVPLTAIRLTPATGRFAGQMAKTVTIVLETAAVRYSFDKSTAPSDTVGVPLAIGDMLTLTDQAFRDLTFHTVAADGTIHVHYFHEV
jgi:hypothetical protein